KLTHDLSVDAHAPREDDLLRRSPRSNPRLRQNLLQPFHRRPSVAWNGGINRKAGRREAQRKVLGDSTRKAPFLNLSAPRTPPFGRSRAQSASWIALSRPWREQITIGS